MGHGKWKENKQEETYHFVFVKATETELKSK